MANSSRRRANDRPDHHVPQVTGPITIASIVEGDGEVSALPRAVPQDRLSGLGRANSPTTPYPAKQVHRLPAESRCRFASLLPGHPAPGGVLLLIDSDDDCPASLGPGAPGTGPREARGDRGISVVLAHREFEAWFLAAAASTVRVSRP